jgi:hypothetical protein
MTKTRAFTLSVALVFAGTACSSGSPEHHYATTTTVYTAPYPGDTVLNLCFQHGGSGLQCSCIESVFKRIVPADEAYGRARSLFQGEPVVGWLASQVGPCIAMH